MASRKSTVRMGPVSIFVLIVVVCVAVLAALSFATAQAQLAVSERQASMEQSNYANESAAQTMIYQASEQLPAMWARGETAQAAARQICDSLALEAGVNGSLQSVEAVGSNINAVFAQPDGRVLSVVLSVKQGEGIEVQQWKGTTERAETVTDGMLFTGK